MPEKPLKSNLAVVRKAAGLSTRELAARSGVPQAVVSRYEHWHAPKGLKSALAIAAALRVKPVEIWPDAKPVVGKGRPTPSPIHRGRKRAPAVAEVRRGAAKSIGETKR